MAKHTAIVTMEGE